MFSQACVIHSVYKGVSFLSSFLGGCLVWGGVSGLRGCLVWGRGMGELLLATAAVGTHPTGMHSCCIAHSESVGNTFYSICIISRFIYATHMTNNIYWFLLWICNYQFVSELTTDCHIWYISQVTCPYGFRCCCTHSVQSAYICFLLTHNPVRYHLIHGSTTGGNCESFLMMW